METPNDMTVDEWQAGWDALVTEAKRRGFVSTSSTMTRNVPHDLWNRIVSYPPKPVDALYRAREHVGG